MCDNPVRTPVHDAIALGDVALVRALLDAGFDVNAVDDEGDTLLHFAQECKRPEMVALLIARHADVNAEDHRGRTPLFYCETAPEAWVMLDAGAWINVEDWNGHKPLYWAQSVEHALRLIEAGSDVDAEAMDENPFVREAYTIHVCGAQRDRFDFSVAGGGRKRA